MRTGGEVELSRGNPKFTGKFQLCWDCRKSTTGECSWSRALEPVEGWEAEKTAISVYKHGYTKVPTYRVQACPEFERDARNGGQERLVV